MTAPPDVLPSTQTATGRALAIVRASNRALIRAADERALFDEICRIAVELDAYRLAWVGWAQADPAQSVHPVAFAGHEVGYLSAIRVSWAVEAHGRGPVGTAIRTGQPVVVNRIGDDPSFAPWRAEAARRGYASVLALPLREGPETVGVLALYAAEPDAFGPAEVDLLSELSDDLGFGIAMLRVRTERERLAAVIEQAPDPIIIADAGRVVAYANPAFLAATNRSRDSVVGRSASELVREVLAPEDAALIVEASDRRQAWLGEVERRGPDGTVHHLELTLTPLLDAQGMFGGEVMVSRDVTSLRGAEAELALAERFQAAQVASLRRMPDDATLEQAAQALCDELVTLPFVEIAGVEAFVNGKQVRIVGLSAPDWLPVQAGDALPAELALLQRTLAQSKPWAIAVTPDAGPFAAALAARGIKALAYGPLLHGGHLDGGLIIATSDDQFARALVEKMPGLVSFSTTTSALLAERLHARRREHELRESLEAVLATRAFGPVFQPIVDLESREIAGYEALTRFASGERPDRCFADAWSVGLGPNLELATLAAAIEAAERLPAGRWLDLNVSPRLLAGPGSLGALLARATRPIVLEVTEHEVVDDYAALRVAIRDLGGHLRLAVDDAGAGVANFGHIIELRPDFVKLDISLVRGVNADPARQALVVAMRHFARTTGCRLVAEGIETEPEAATLLGLGVEFGQGYLLGLPEPVEA